MRLKKNAPAAGPDNETLRGTLADIAAESWRLDRVVEHMLARMDIMDSERFLSQYRWYQKKVDEALARSDMRIVDLTGQDYDVGMAVTPLNIDEFDDEPLCVAQMLEPIIMGGGRVLRTGSVMLAEKF